MGITHHPAVIQGSDEWLALRCGLLTASELHLIVTPKTLKAASDDKERAHVWELCAQRLTRYVEPHYISDDMLRGMDDEALARQLYSERYEPTQECGFITNDEFGFTLGYSPDALVGDDGLIECKSRRQKFQIETIVTHAQTGEIPPEYVIQCQSGLLISRRKWLDLVSYCGGLPMYVMRVHPDAAIQNAIVEAAGEFERRIGERMSAFLAAMRDAPEKFTPTERRIIQEMYA